jgi:hypothetical protein
VDGQGGIVGIIVVRVAAHFTDCDVMLVEIQVRRWEREKMDHGRQDKNTRVTAVGWR